MSELVRFVKIKTKAGAEIRVCRPQIALLVTEGIPSDNQVMRCMLVMASGHCEEFVADYNDMQEFIRDVDYYAAVEAANAMGKALAQGLDACVRPGPVPQPRREKPE